MRFSLPAIVLSCVLLAGAQQAPPPAAAKAPRPSPDLVALRQELEAGIQQRVEMEVRKAQMENDQKLQQALQQARMDSRQEIESLRREVQSLQQAVWSLQSRVRD